MDAYYKNLKRIRHYLGNRPKPAGLIYDHRGEEVSKLLYSKVLSDHPLMVARYGSTEMTNIVTYLCKNDPSSFIGKSLRFATGDMHFFWWDASVTEILGTHSGFFPVKVSLIEQFSELMLECSKDVDVLGTWLPEERYLTPYLENAVKVPLADLEPYYHSFPWSYGLEGKKVLVIHPFEQTILRQYSKRELLFNDKRVLPEFDLVTIKAVQSLANTKTEFSSWFDALDFMKNQIVSKDFDIAILGCGAYGFPLASFIKRLGKKAIHLGGASQLLFGIKGKRWEQGSEQTTALFNEHWTYADEKPDNYQTIEGGCYW